MSFERRNISSAAIRLSKGAGQKSLSRAQYRIVNIPTPVNIRLFPNADEIRLYGAPPALRRIDRERRLEKVLEDTPYDQRRRTRPEVFQMVELLEDIRKELRDVKSQLAEKEHPRGQEVYINLPLTLDGGLVHLDFTDPAGNVNVPATAVTQIPSGKLFSIAIHNDTASTSDVRISMNVGDEETRARLVLRPGETHAVDWKTALTYSLNLVAVTGTATVIITGMV